MVKEACEMAGWYGPYSLAEREIQRLWMRQRLLSGPWRTLSGRFLEVIDCGKWNLLAGPDFRDAVWCLDGKRVTGDVEVHFVTQQWSEHGHDRDPAYAGVKLHVVVFPPARGDPPAITFSGGEPETLVLLDLLPVDLESLADELALMRMGRADWDELLSSMLQVSRNERRERLRDHALKRWHRSVEWADRRLTHDGWEEALHQLTLECLGFSSNREPMARLSLICPATMWRAQQVDIERAITFPGLHWRQRGVRPANRPLQRLRVYEDWWRRNGQWPAQVLEMVQRLGPWSGTDLAQVSVVRRRFRLAALRSQLECRFALMGPGRKRLDTWWADVVWPLAAARTGVDFSGYWLAWYPGDFPEGMRRLIRQADILPDLRSPLSVGVLQGVMGWRSSGS